MQHGNIVSSGLFRRFVGMAALAVLTFAILLLPMPKADATPALAKGKPCSTCHTGSPPSKSNVK